MEAVARIVNVPPGLPVDVQGVQCSPPSLFLPYRPSVMHGRASGELELAISLYGDTARDDE